MEPELCRAFEGADKQVEFNGGMWEVVTEELRTLRIIKNLQGELSTAWGAWKISTFEGFKNKLDKHLVGML